MDYDFDQLYPNRFLKSGQLKDKSWTLTIKAVDLEELHDKKGKNGKKLKPVITFVETELQMVTCKTNGLSLLVMFGRKTRDWIGRRVTLYPLQGEWFGKSQQALRVLGSPDIPSDIVQEVQLGTEKALVTMRKTKGPPARAQSVESVQSDPETGEVPLLDAGIPGL